MPALERLMACRIVADPDAIDRADWFQEALVVRFSPDEALGVGARGARVTDQHAIVTQDVGWVGAWLSTRELRAVLSRAEWTPGPRWTVAQGAVAGVPIKLIRNPNPVIDGFDALLLTQAPYVHELETRLGWRS